MNPRVLIPLAVVLLAAYLGWREYQAGTIAVPGAPPASSATPSAGAQPEPAPAPAEPEPAPEPTPAPEPAPSPAEPTSTPQAAPPEAPTGTTASPAPEPASPTPATPSAPATGYPEARLTAPDTAPAVNLRPERAAVLEAYASGAYARTIALADAWLNSRPTDALVMLARQNALQRQLGRQLLTVGLSVPTSGADVQRGEAVLQGVNLAVMEANREGVRGRGVIVAVRNDQNSRELAVEAASAFLGGDVLGVVGPIGSSPALAAADLYNSGGLAALLPTATDDRLGSAGSAIYRLAPPNSAQGRALARLAKERGYTRVPVYLDPSDAYSKSLADAFVAEARRLEISAVPFEFKSGSLPSGDAFDTYGDPPLPDAAFVAGGPADVARIARALRERGVTVPLLAGDAAYSQSLLQEGGAAVDGLTLLSFFLASSDLEGVAPFVRAFRARYGGGTPNARAAQAYDAARTLLEAIRRAPTLDRAGVLTALAGFAQNPGPGVTSSVRFSNGGIVGRPFVVIQVRNGALTAEGTVR